MQRTLALDALIEIYGEFKTSSESRWILAALIPIAYLLPKLVFTIIVFILGIVLGLILQEGLTDKEGGYGLVLNHYQERIANKVVIKTKSPPLEPIPLKVAEELREALNEFVGYIIRDFINGWYSKVNLSGSQEFPDAVHKSINFAFLEMGHAISKVSPTDLILTVMKTVIDHVKEFREFDASGLDIQDFQKLHPKSKFAQYASMELLIQKLRAVSLTLINHFLPEADQSSAALIGIVREIVATKVLLPMFEKVTAPEYLNENLLLVMKKKSEETKQDTKDSVEVDEDGLSLESLYWDQHLEDLQKNALQRINDIKRQIESGEGDVEQLLLEKIKVQGQVEELTDLINQGRESGTTSNSLYPIYKSEVFIVLMEPETSDSILNGLSKRFSYQSGSQLMITMKYSTDVAWTVIKDLKDFEELMGKLKFQFPRAVTDTPKILRKRQSLVFADMRTLDIDSTDQIAEWLGRLIKDPVCSVVPELVKFLQPGQAEKEETSTFTPIKGIIDSASAISVSDVISNAGNALNNAGNAIRTAATSINILESNNPTKNYGELNEEPESSVSAQELGSIIGQEDLDIILDIIFTTIEELFFLAEKEQWMRQQSLHLIKALLKRIYGYQIAKKLTEKLEVASSQASIANAVKAVSFVMWPEGRIWGQGPPPIIRTSAEKDRIKHQLFCLLTKQEGMVKNDDFRKAVKGIQNLVGSKNTKAGLLRGFHLIQNQLINLGLCCEVLEQIVAKITTSV